MIVCCGEALIDFLPRKSADGASVYQPFCGGSVYNTAIALGRLGSKTGCLQGMLTDVLCDWLPEGITGSRVDICHAEVGERT